MDQIRQKEIINREDCPPGEAPFFPGQKTKNNKNGTTLSKIQFVNKVIEDWVRHFKDNKKYENTLWGHKTMYLQRYLKPISVGIKEAQKRLIEIETKIACETEENELIQSQNILNAEMEIESNSKNDDKETSELKIIKSNST